MSKKVRSHAKEVFFALLGDRPVAYHPMIAHVLGSVKEALFVSQLLYWHDKGKLPDGWIWKTREEWTEETGLSRREIEGARKRLVAKGVLEEKLKGIPATLHYRLNLDRLYELTEEWTACKLDCTKRANLIAPNVQTKIAPNVQTISESTTETSPEITAAAAPEKQNSFSEEEQQQQPKLDINFGTALKAYQDRFGPLGSSHLYDKFQMLWDEHPRLKTHQYARKEMYRAMMRKESHVRPNLAYYAQCLATGAARAEGAQEERRGNGKRRDVPKRTVADINDPAIQEWLAERRANGTDN